MGGDAAEIVQIGDAVGLVAGIFDKLYKLFKEDLANLDPRGRRLFQAPKIDFTQLLSGLDFEGIKVTFEGFKNRAQDLVGKIKGINATISPLLGELKAALARRRLGDVAATIKNTKQVADEIQTDQAKYEEAILEVTPSWRGVEGLAKDVCGETEKAMVEVNALQCRVDEFGKQVKIPGVDILKDIKMGCKDDGNKEINKANASCPVASHSENVRDMLSQNAGVLGWTAVTFQYAIIHNSVLRIIGGLLVILCSLQLGLLGYRLKDCEMWIEGFLAGLVVWSIVISVFIAMFGVCRGQYIDKCEPKWMLVVVVILSLLCSFGTVKFQKLQVFLAGFDLGAMIGGCVFFAFKYEDIFNTFIHADSSNDLLYCLLASALVTGLVLGVLTVKLEKPLIVVCTATIGAFGVVFAFAIFLLRFMDKIDLVVWVLLSIAFSAFQWFVTAHNEENPGDNPSGNVKSKYCWEKTEETEGLNNPPDENTDREHG